MAVRTFLLFTLLMTVAHARVHAQSLEQPDLDRAAREMFEAGREAFDAGRYAEALENFEHAHMASGRAELLYDIGLAADRLREDERALRAFERYLQEAVDPVHRDQVAARVAALRAARERARVKDEQRRALEAAEVARAAQRAPQPAPASATVDDAQRDDSDGGVLTTWWFWTGAAVLLAGGAAAVYVATRPHEKSDLPAPNTGVVVQTLRFGP
jgi:tetratricopeptide (TPR) repeat protein